MGELVRWLYVKFTLGCHRFPTPLSQVNGCQWGKVLDSLLTRHATKGKENTASPRRYLFTRITDVVECDFTRESKQRLCKAIAIRRRMAGRWSNYHQSATG